MFNHIIDPLYFNDAIELFAFNYDIFVATGKKIDEYGKAHITYEKQFIRGSLQSQGTKVIRDKRGNTITSTYDFYCKSLYRINIGDFIKYQNKWLIVTDVRDYDEYGVRSCSLNMIQLTAYRDLSDYVKFIEGKEIV